MYSIGEYGHLFKYEWLQYSNLWKLDAEYSYLNECCKELLNDDDFDVDLVDDADDFDDENICSFTI